MEKINRRGITAGFLSIIFMLSSCISQNPNISDPLPKIPDPTGEFPVKSADQSPGSVAEKTVAAAVQPIAPATAEQARLKIYDKNKIKELQTVGGESLSSYRLAAGDKMSISVFGEKDFSIEARLSDTGTIIYPVLGELKVEGLTVSELNDLITKGLIGDYLVNPQVTTTIVEYRKFFIDGQVKNPGGYAYLPGLTVQKAISLAGGFTELASRNKIFIIREKDLTSKPELIDMNGIVQPGDIITVEESFF